MRDLRSPVFLHVDGGGILINLIVWLGERKTRRAVTVCCSKNIGGTCTVFYIKNN